MPPRSKKHDGSPAVDLLLDAHRYGPAAVASSAKRAPKKGGKRGSGKSFQVGEKCLALYHDDGQWYDAEIERILGNDKFLIRYVEYDERATLPGTHLEQLAVAAAVTESKKSPKVGASTPPAAAAAAVARGEGVPEVPVVAAKPIAPPAIGSSPFSCDDDDNDTNDNKGDEGKEGAASVVSVPAKKMVLAPSAIASSVARASSRSPTARATPPSAAAVAVIPEFDLHNHDRVTPAPIVYIGGGSPRSSSHIEYVDNGHHHASRHGGHNSRSARIARAGVASGVSSATTRAVVRSPTAGRRAHSTAIPSASSTSIYAPNYHPYGDNGGTIYGLTPSASSPAAPVSSPAAPVVRSANAPIPVPAANTAAAHHIATTGFACRMCTFDNAAGATKCVVCDTPRGAVLPTPSAAAPVTAAPPAAARSPSSPSVTPRPVSSPVASSSSPSPTARASPSPSTPPIAVAIAVPVTNSATPSPVKVSGVASPSGSDDGLWHEDDDEPGMVIIDPKK